MDRVRELLLISNRITKEYEALLPLLRDPDVVKAVRFLTELDVLAEQYDFSSADIVRLIDPGRAERMNTQAVESKKPGRASKRSSQSK
jgi:hypothetical protein